MTVRIEYEGTPPPFPDAAERRRHALLQAAAAIAGDSILVDRDGFMRVAPSCPNNPAGIWHESDGAKCKWCGFVPDRAHYCGISHPCNSRECEKGPAKIAQRIAAAVIAASQVLEEIESREGAK